MDRELPCFHSEYHCFRTSEILFGFRLSCYTRLEIFGRLSGRKAQTYADLIKHSKYRFQWGDRNLKLDVSTQVWFGLLIWLLSPIQLRWEMFRWILCFDVKEFLSEFCLILSGWFVNDNWGVGIDNARLPVRLEKGNSYFLWLPVVQVQLIKNSHCILSDQFVNFKIRIESKASAQTTVVD